MATNLEGRSEMSNLINQESKKSRKTAAIPRTMLSNFLLSSSPDSSFLQPCPSIPKTVSDALAGA